MEKIKDILMERDDLTEEEANDVIEEVLEMCKEVLDDGNVFEVENIIREELGLEPDYLMEILEMRGR